jgi:hypothetical protein
VHSAITDIFDREAVWLQTEFEASPGSIAVPLLKGPKSRSVTVSLPGRFSQSRPTVSHQYTVASGAFCNLLPVSGSAHEVLLMRDFTTVTALCGCWYTDLSHVLPSGRLGA